MEEAIGVKELVDGGYWGRTWCGVYKNTAKDSEGKYTERWPQGSRIKAKINNKKNVF